MGHFSCVCVRERERKRERGREREEEREIVRESESVCVHIIDMGLSWSSTCGPQTIGSNSLGDCFPRAPMGRRKGTNGVRKETL